MAPPGQLHHAGSGISGSRKSKAFDNTSAAAAMMSQGKLSAEAGMAAASQAAIQARQRAQQRQQDELCAAALTHPQQRTQTQIEILCSFLSSAHLLRNLQPTNIKDLAQSMAGRECAMGELVYKQNDPAKHFYLVLTGEVSMYETDLHSSAGAGGSSAGSPLLLGQETSAAGISNGSFSGNTIMNGGGSKHQRAASQCSKAGSRAGNASSPRVRTAAGNTAGLPYDMIEVRKVGPREAFGEDDIQAGSKREQTAVAGAANSCTFASMALPSTAGSAATAAPTGITGAVNAASNESSSKTRAFLDARRRTMGEEGRSAAAGSVAAPGAVLLQLSSDDYGAVLEGRLSTMLEEKVSFLADLPALKGLSPTYLRSLSHCFHQVQFEPREVLVRQGDASDCLYVLKAGQVCILIDPNLTLAEGSTAAGQSPSAEASAASNIDTKKLVQVCLLGSGSIIGDMSVREGPGGPPRRSATVVALTELLTYKVPLKEFKRRMPADVLEAMRHVASQKLVMNENQASSRTKAAAAGKLGHIMLGGTAVPEGVLRGKGLRALVDAERQAAGQVPVGGLLDALDVYFGTGPAGGPKRVPLSQTAAVEEYVSSLSRNGFITAPPEEFLALLTDWRTPREAANSSPEDRRMPVGREFPLPIPKHPSRSAASAADCTTSQAAAADSYSLPTSTTSSSTPTVGPIGMSLFPAFSRTSDPSHAAHAQVGAYKNMWGKTPAPAPAIQVHTHVPGSADNSPSTAVPIGSLQSMPHAAAALMSSTTRGAYISSGVGSGLASPLSHGSCSPGWVSPLMASPRLAPDKRPEMAAAVASTRALRDTLDQLVQQKQGGKASDGSNAGITSNVKVKLQAAAVVREATQQLACGLANGGAAAGYSSYTGPAVGGGFKGLQRSGQSPRPLIIMNPAPAAADSEKLPKPAAAAGTACCGGCSSREPTLHEASIKASMLFRPGSPISITSGRVSPLSPAGASTGGFASSRSPKQAGRSRTKTPMTEDTAAAVSKTMAVLDSFGTNISAAVVLNQAGVPQLDFHTHGTGELLPAQPGKVAPPAP